MLAHKPRRFRFSDTIGYGCFADNATFFKFGGAGQLDMRKVPIHPCMAVMIESLACMYHHLAAKLGSPVAVLDVFMPIDDEPRPRLLYA